MAYDDKGYVASVLLHRVYHRYTFYNAANEVQSRSGFILMSYLLPPGIAGNYTKQYVTLYDSIDYDHEFDEGFSQRYILAGIPLNTTSNINFALNTTYDFHTNGTRSGLVVGIPTGTDYSI